MFEFKKLKEADLQMVLDWRVKPSVSQNMFTEVEYNLDKQKKWFQTLATNPRVAYWIIYFNKKPIGLVNLADYDPSNLRTNLGYYIGEDDFRFLGGMVLPYVYNYVFRTLNLNKIYGEVVDGASILKLHDSFGYRRVGTYKNHFKKDGEWKDVHVVELLKEDWINLKKYEKYTAKFEA